MLGLAGCVTNNDTLWMRTASCCRGNLQEMPMKRWKFSLVLEASILVILGAATVARARPDDKPTQPSCCEGVGRSRFPVS